MSAITDTLELRALAAIDAMQFKPDGLTGEGRALAMERGWDPDDERTPALVLAVVMARIMG
jgi:hypothetical protein